MSLRVYRRILLSKSSFKRLIFEFFFCKKIPLSRRVGYVIDGWISGSAMYVCHTNQIGSTINSQSNFFF